MRSQRGMERPAVIGRWVNMELTEAGIWSFPNPAAASLLMNARRTGASFPSEPKFRLLCVCIAFVLVVSKQRDTSGHLVDAVSPVLPVL